MISFVTSEINKYSIYTKNLTILYYIFIATKYAPKTNKNINLKMFQFIKALKIYHSWLFTSRPRCKLHASVPVKFNDFKNLFFKNQTFCLPVSCILFVKNSTLPASIGEAL